MLSLKCIFIEIHLCSMRLILLHIILLTCFCVKLISQEVSISSELSLRNYFSYDILGDIDGKAIVFRDKGFVKEIDVFNRDLELVQSAELFFEKKRVDVFCITEHDSVFQILYGYFERDTMFFKYRTYNNSVVLQDSSLILALHKREIRKKVVSTISEDKSKILLSTIDENDKLIFLLYNAQTRSLEWSSKVQLTGKFENKTSGIVLANNGDFVILLREKLWTSNPNALTTVLIAPRYNLQKYVSFSLRDFNIDNFVIKPDNHNQSWLFCGTYSEKKSKEAEGYFYISKKFEAFDGIEIFNFLPFESNLYSELIQGRKKKSKIFEDIKLKDIIFRNDGGFIVISEIAREYSRRNPYSTYAQSSYDGYSRRSWIDYYNDDIIVTNINPTGDILWNKVLYKKQFSQDDDGIYSSFFVLRTPSRLRFIYNDEIKKNNTVSEYLMDPVGKIARNSLMSTAYQKMKLRFKDAIQISSNSIIVPSERSYDLNLVRITY